LLGVRRDRVYRGTKDVRRKYEGGIVGHLVPRSQASRLATGIRRWRWHSVLSLCMFIVCGIFTITVNKESVVNIEGVFEKEALRVLHDIPRGQRG